MLTLTFLSDAASWKNPAIRQLQKELRRKGHRVRAAHTLAGVGSGDLLFILGFFRIVPPAVLKRHRHNIVVHESALPKNRGWSPLSWQVLRGATTIPVSLFEAQESVDSGDVYLTGKIKLKGHELLPEIQNAAAAEMVRLCRTFIARYPGVLSGAQKQKGKATYLPKRTPKDSRLDPSRSLSRQFNLLRIADADAYPAFFELKGHTYILRLEKKSD